MIHGCKKISVPPSLSLQFLPILLTLFLQPVKQKVFSQVS